MTELDGLDAGSTEDILAEIETRRRTRRPMSERERRIIIFADRIIYWLTNHWLLLLNLLAVLYVGLPLLAPVSMVLGFPGLARVIYALYQPLCHQLPQRSWFLFGQQASYSISELTELLGGSSVPGAWQSAFIGNADLGYKVAICERCTAIYGTIALAGVIYGALRRRWKVPPMPIWAYLVFGIIPMLLDGGWQWLSYAISLLLPQLPIDPHETTPMLRTVTGTLFGLSTVWLAYPYVEETMNEFKETLQNRFGWE